MRAGATVPHSDAMFRPILLPCAAIAGAVLAGGAAAPLPAATGHEVAERQCASCHAIDLTGESPDPLAPPLRDLFKRYPVYALDEMLRKGLEVGHRRMPRFVLPSEDIGPLLDYLRDLDPCAKPSADRAAMERCFAPL